MAWRNGLLDGCNQMGLSSARQAAENKAITSLQTRIKVLGELFSNVERVRLLFRLCMEVIESASYEPLRDRGLVQYSPPLGLCKLG